MQALASTDRFPVLLRSLAIALILFLTYSLTRPPYLSLNRGTDGGELTIAAAMFGIAHPPGYGLYTLTSGIALHVLPGESAVQKMHLVSSLTAIGLSLLVGALVAAQFTDSLYKRQVFTLAALLCGWSQPVWEQALMIEVYLVLALLLAALWWLILSNGQSTGLMYQTPTRLFLIGHLLGVAITHHLTVLLWLPGTLILVWRRDVEWQRVLRRMPFVLVGVLTGLWPWAYLIARAGHVPEGKWGGIERGAEAFIAHITAQDYRVFLQPISLEAILQGIVRSVMSLPTQMTPFGAVLLLVGILLSIPQRHRRRWVLAMLVWIVCVAGFTGLYRAPETQMAYTLPMVIPVVITTTVGVMRLMVAWHWKVREVIVWLLPLMIFLGYARNIDYRGDTSGLTFLAQVDAHAPPDAIVLVERDAETFLLWQAHLLEGWRPDVAIVNVTLLHQDWYAQSLSVLYPDLPLAGTTQAERLQSLYTTTRPLVAPRLIRPPAGMRSVPMGQGWYCLARTAEACS